MIITDNYISPKTMILVEHHIRYWRSRFDTILLRSLRATYLTDCYMSWTATTLCSNFLTENPDALVLASCPQGAGKSRGWEETLLCLCDWIAAWLSWVSEYCQLIVSSFYSARTHTNWKGLCFMLYEFRRQMAEALGKLNVPVTVVLDAAVG